MAYVRKSKSRGKTYRQVVESYREDGKVKQRVLVHLGRYATPEEKAEKYEGFAWRAREVSQRERVRGTPEAQEWERKAEKYEAMAGHIRDLITSGRIASDSPEVKENRQKKHKEALATLTTLEGKL